MFNLIPPPKQQFTDDNGDPLVGGMLYSYMAGTSTPAATYTDSTGGTPNTNPIILDSSGQANVWVPAGGYKFVLEDALGNILWTVDNVTSQLTSAQATALLNVFTASLQGAVPASGGGTTNFLRADGEWANPPGGGGGSGIPTITGSRSSPNPVVAASGIPFTSTNYGNIAFIVGSGGPVTVSANPQIAAGTLLGQALELFSTDNTKTVTVQDGNGLDLNGTWVGANGSRLGLLWDGSLWSESYRR